MIAADAWWAAELEQLQADRTRDVFTGVRRFKPEHPNRLCAFDRAGAIYRLRGKDGHRTWHCVCGSWVVGPIERPP